MNTMSYFNQFILLFGHLFVYVFKIIFSFGIWVLLFIVGLFLLSVLVFQSVPLFPLMYFGFVFYLLLNLFRIKVLVLWKLFFLILFRPISLDNLNTLLLNSSSQWTLSFYFLTSSLVSETQRIHKYLKHTRGSGHWNIRGGIFLLLI